MPARRVLIIDPAGRRGGELAELASAAGWSAEVCSSLAGRSGEPDKALVLVSASAAASLGEAPRGAVRWVFGEPGDAGKLAGAAVACGAVGVLLAPVTASMLSAASVADAPIPEHEQARLRSLLAVSLFDDGDGSVPLAAIATAFAADDCVVWWRDGAAMVPRAARATADDTVRAAVGVAARVAAATGGCAIIGVGGGARTVIAAPLRAGPGEVAGMMAVVTDRARNHGAGERTDLRALAARLTRELQQVASYRRLVAEEERLRAGTSTDSLTHALTRTAFEQAVGNELAAAARRGEPLALVLLDIVGLRRINLEHGHPAGDEVLAQLASRVHGALRPSDLLARFGGDELALLLVNTTVEQARALAEDVRVRISGAPVAVGGEGSVAVSLRVVIAPLDPAERSGEACFARAVGALRAARPDAVTVVAADARVPEADVALDQASLAVGATLGGSYRILHELSRGAMGVVYRGEDIGLGRPVAIKVLRSDLALDRELVGRFRAEAAMLASLHHPNLVQIYALGEQAGDVYFVMELVEGQPLSEVLRTMLDRRQWMPAAAVAQIAVEIADALDAMHQVGVIHRDVKPGNVLLDRANGRAVLVDVGVATRTGVRGEGAGTPGFAAPESLALGAGETVTASESIATDVYGLAATVYSLLTGRTPFGSGNVMAVVARQLSEPLTPPSTHRPELTRAVDEVLAKALDPVPRRRWASASSFAVALARALEKVREDDADAGRITAEMVAERPTNLPTPTPLAASDKAAAMVTEVLPDGLAPTIGPQRSESGRLHGIDGDLRGAHFRVAARGITSRLGEQVLRTLIDSSPQLARVLSPSLPALGWEPIEAFVELLDRTASLMAPDDLARMVGRATIHATFARFFGANPASLPVETVMRAAPTFWGRYHSWSRLELGLAAPRHVELSLLGESLPPLCALTGAQLMRVAELAGARDVALSHARCRSLGAPECSFVLAWS